MSAIMHNPLLGRSAPAVTPVRMGGSTGHVGEFGPTRLNPDGSPHIHKGLDLLAMPAWPVFATHDGIVTVSGWENERDAAQGYGQRIKVESGGRMLRTVYAHLSVLFARVGSRVSSGTVLGLTGRTGNVGTDPSIPTHLHFEVHRGDGTGDLWIPIDPARWLMGQEPEISVA